MHIFNDQFFSEDMNEQVKNDNLKLIEIGNLARKCLSSTDFNHYKELFEKEKDSIINAMVVYTSRFGKQGNESIEIYAFNMMRFVQQITDLRKLLTAVETDARKGFNDKDSKV